MLPASCAVLTNTIPPSSLWVLSFLYPHRKEVILLLMDPTNPSPLACSKRDPGMEAAWDLKMDLFMWRRAESWSSTWPLPPSSPQASLSSGMGSWSLVAVEGSRKPLKPFPGVTLARSRIGSHVLEEGASIFFVLQEAGPP